MKETKQLIQELRKLPNWSQKKSTEVAVFSAKLRLGNYQRRNPDEWQITAALEMIKGREATGGHARRIECRIADVMDSENRQGIVGRIFFSQFTSKRHVDEALETLQSIHEERV